MFWKNGTFAESELRAHSNAVTAVEFSSDGSRLATATESEVRVWDRSTGRLLLTREAREPRQLAFTGDGSQLAIAAMGIHGFSVRGGPGLHFSVDDYTPVVAVSKSGRLVAGGFNGEAQVWDLKSRLLLRRFETGIGDFKCVSFSPDGKRLLACDGGGTTWFWDLESGRNVGQFETQGSTAVARFQEDGNHLVLLRGTLGMRFTLDLLEAATWEEIRSAEDREIGWRRRWTKK